jgi:O-methyltransferase
MGGMRHRGEAFALESNKTQLKTANASPLRLTMYQTLARHFRAIRDEDAKRKELALWRPYTMVDDQALLNLKALAASVLERMIPGSFVECGVYNGGSAAIVASLIAHDDRCLWLFDSFSGMPATTPVDGLDARAYIGQCVGSEDRVLEALALANFPREKLVMCKGWFVDTFQGELPEQVSFLHIDADWYENIKLCLETFYDRVPNGGVIVLDDFAYWEGCREAFYDFCFSRGIKPLLERCGLQQAYWIKSKSHNRNG